MSQQETIELRPLAVASTSDATVTASQSRDEGSTLSSPGPELIVSLGLRYTHPRTATTRKTSGKCMRLILVDILLILVCVHFNFQLFLNCFGKTRFPWHWGGIYRKFILLEFSTVCMSAFVISSKVGGVQYLCLSIIRSLKEQTLYVWLCCKPIPGGVTSSITPLGPTWMGYPFISH